MRRFLIAACVAGLVALGTPGTAWAQDTPAPADETEPVVTASVDPVSADEVVSACATASDRVDCLAKDNLFVNQVKASNTPLDQQQQDLNALVTNLANSAEGVECPSEQSALIADAIAEIATNAADVIDAATVNGIADGIRACDTGVTTAAVAPDASAG